MLKIKNFLWVMIFVFSITLVKAQKHSLGISGSYGVSKIKTSYSLFGGFADGKAVGAGNYGFFYEMKLKRKWSFGFEILSVSIGGKHEVDRQRRVTTSIGTQPSTATSNTSVFSSKLRIHSTHLALPMYVRLGIGQLGLKMGIQAMWAVHVKGKYETWGTNNGVAFETTNENPDIIYDEWDFGPKLGLDYKLSNRLGIRLDYYVGLTDWTPLYEYEVWKNRQLSVGLSYIFLKY